MRITPAAQHGSAVWAHDHAPMMTVGVWTEKKPGQGEDAEPLVLFCGSSRLGLLAVCDGVGGAGVQVAGRTSDGTERSGAWVSSRAVRLALEQYFVRRVQYVQSQGLAGLDQAGGPELPGSALPDPALPGPAPPSLRRNIDGVLQELRNPARRRIGGTMQRELPSTLAALIYRVELPAVQVQVRWAGDSRCYLLTPGAGLQQLSRDDTEMPDALRSLEQDPPMTNQIAADGKYEIHSAEQHMTAPCVLLCATDGFFNYVQTPAHFEYILLDTLTSADSLAGWGGLLAGRVQGYTQDDASLALAAPGYTSFGELQAGFAARLSALRAEHWQPLQGLPQSDDGAYRAARLDSWQRYRPGYEQRIAQPSEARG